MMYGRGLLARMGDGTVHRIADQYEAERIKRETGDQDMFVFQDPGFNDENERSIWGRSPDTGNQPGARAC